ncbi:hypothetical protein Cgig2_017797 [Carnegiea gigantea]|uniref:Uncharacterized protein n=1 Tax=Carnegiea gigantea TaxID=171969 RepID=A0A9Q1KV01_9CARY|nr:hypothetical protein Cgig2_017797 [Carnegiea gigantea]
MKIASAIVRRILVDTGSSVDIITWDCLKKLAHPRCDIVPMANPILGFGLHEVHPSGTIRLPVHRGPPQQPVHVRPQSAGRAHNTGRLRIRLQELARPCRSRRGCPSGLADSPAPWPGPHQSRLSTADAASPSHGPLGPPGASHNTFGAGKRVPPATGTLRRPSPPGQRPQPLPSPPRTPLGGPKPQRWPSHRI